MDIYDLKIIPLSEYHVEYLTRQINSDKLLQKVRTFEIMYDIEKNVYPLASEEQLQYLTDRMKKNKTGLTSSIMTTMFKTLQILFQTPSKMMKRCC